ncbi:MAG: FecR domain-containing protein [Gammaproteobacteria bacterium]|nr:FecR domain-containing protein [Gammaproteobacteria bacterium]
MFFAASRQSPWFVVVLVALLCLSAQAMAQQQPAGRVTISLGLVEAVDSAGATRRLGRGDPVFVGETLRTGSSGRAQIRFTDRGVMSLRPDTVLSLDDYEFDAAAPASARQTMTLDRGGFRSQTGRVVAANRAGYRVQTPVAVIGIRGTVYEAQQDVGGALFVGSTQGGVEVQSNTGIVGRIGAGESFNFLRVNPDGSIDFLLEAPDAFSVTPGIDEGEEDEEGNGFDAGDAGDGLSAVQSTDGTDSTAGAEFLAMTSDPESTGSIAPSQSGSGSPPTTQPLDPVDPIDPVDPVDPVAVLSPAQTAALLADQRFGLAIGLEGSDGGPGLFGGLATFNSPLLALDSSRVGLGSGIAGSGRQALLDAADLLLLPESGTFTVEADKAGVTGLVWGRFAAPVTVFIDPDDASRTIELDRELLFVLGSPTDIADLNGIFFYELSAWDAISSGLPISTVLASGALDLGTGVYAGFIDILFGEDSATGLSLFAEFQSQVNGGVLEGIQFGSFDLFDFATESTVAAEGDLAGFFTGDAAAFLQLAFDFRVPSRSDADVRGLALLARQLDPEPEPTAVLSAAQRGLLLNDDRLVLATGIQGEVELVIADFEAGPVVLAGGLGTLENGNPILALDSTAPGFPPGAATTDREALLAAADVILLPGSGDFTLEQDVEGIPGLTWGRFAAPAQLFVDPLDDSRRLTVEQDVLFALGTPVPIASLQGQRSFDAMRIEAVTGGLLIDGFSGIVDLDLGDGFLAGFLDFFLMDSMESSFGTVISDFEALVTNGILEDVFVEVFFSTGFSGAEDGNGFGEQGVGTLAGFFTGNDAEFLQLVFDYRFPNTPMANVAGLALFELTDEFMLPPGALTLQEEFALDQGFTFIATNCCFQDGGRPTGVFGGFASDPRPSNGNDTLLGFNLSPLGQPAEPFDSAFTFFPPDRVIRRNGAETVVFIDDLGLDLAAFEWHGFESPALEFDAFDGTVTGIFEENLLVITGIPTPTANLMGWARYELLDIVQGFYLDEAGFLDPTPLTDVTMEFNVDFATGALTDGYFEARIPDFSFEEFPGSLRVTFAGQVAFSNFNPYVDFTILSGVLLDEFFANDDFLDLSRSSLGGFFTGNQGEGFAAAFHFQTEGDNFLDDALDPVLFVGNALLGRSDLSLSAAEAMAFGNGLAVTGFGCCNFGRSFSGLATPDDGDAVLGINLDAALQPQVLLRRAGAVAIPPVFIPGVFGEDTDAELRQIRWGLDRGRPLAVDPVSGNIIAALDDFVMFQTAMPSSPALLVSKGFATFGGFYNFNFPADPRDTADLRALSSETINFLPGLGASFNVDLATGEIFNGHLFVVEERNFASTPGRDFGIEVFFDGFVGSAENSPYAVMNVLEGHRNGVPIDPSASSIEGFFAGSTGVIFAGSFNLETDEVTPVKVSGIFSISDFMTPETRLVRQDVENWSGFGLAAFRGDLFEPEIEQSVLLGRSGPVALGEPFVLGANPLGLFDNGMQVADTRRREFLLQPFDFVLREGSFMPFDFDANVIPMGSELDFSGFEVSWGRWEDSSGSAGQIQNDPGNPASVINISNVFIANADPTPLAQIANLTGEVSYAGGAFAPIAFLGEGGGDASGFFASPILEFDVGFELDFGSGFISNGGFLARYEAMGGNEVIWDVGFSGFLNGAITDLRIDSVAVGVGEPVPVMEHVGTLSGLLTGPNAERHLGAFSISAALQTEQVEHLHGLWLIERGPN